MNLGQIKKPMFNCDYSQQNGSCPYALLPPLVKLGQGYVFTGVCDSVHRGGVPDQVHPPGPGTPPNQVHPPTAEHGGRYGQFAGGTHPTGMQSC